MNTIFDIFRIYMYTLKQTTRCLIKTTVGSLLSRQLGSLCYSNQGGYSTGKTGNLVINFSRQVKHRESKELNKATGKIQGIWTRQGKRIIFRFNLWFNK